jgi:hypothetical protein
LAEFVVENSTLERANGARLRVGEFQVERINAERQLDATRQGFDVGS